jgi:hypothetical protein
MTPLPRWLPVRAGALRRHAQLFALLVSTLAVHAGAAFVPTQSSEQPRVQAQAGAPANQATLPAPRTKPAGTKVAAGPKAESRPAWGELSPSQQQSLAPLAGSWNTLSEAHKRKWIALSQNYPRLPPAEQARVHSRMAEWAALSPQQRTQARLNFAETKKVPSQDKKAAWEAYQALPPEERRKLAAGAAAAQPAPPPTAPAVQPVPRQKLAKVPKSGRADPRSPRVAGGPNRLDHNTLLPQPGAVSGP